MDDIDSSYTARKQPGRPFIKGDPRINRKGRPKSFDALRKLALQIAHETEMKDGKPLIIDGHKITITENILRQWAKSKIPILQQKFIEICFGKVPDQIDIGLYTTEEASALIINIFNILQDIVPKELLGEIGERLNALPEKSDKP